MRLETVLSVLCLGFMGSLTVSGESSDPHADVCQQPKVVGPCRASKLRFWYNSQSGKCEQFTYGGCGGNDNNFREEADCISICMENSTAPEATTEKSVQRAADYMCHQPMEVGPCRASIPRFWFNDKTNQCEQFIYGGCEGNDNNFERESECVRMCKERGYKATTSTTTTARPVQRSHDLCSLPQEVGSCRALLPRYWYNSESGKCEPFDYGGCDGNANNFKKESQCIATCIERTEDQQGVVTQTHHHQEPAVHKKHDENGALLYNGCLTLIVSCTVFHALMRRW